MLFFKLNLKFRNGSNEKCGEISLKIDEYTYVASKKTLVYG